MSLSPLFLVESPDLSETSETIHEDSPDSARGRPVTSLIWLYFERSKNPDKSSCNKCGANFNGHKTCNLESHLKSKHHLVYCDFQRLTKEKLASSANNSAKCGEVQKSSDIRPLLTQKKWSNDDPNQKKVKQLLAVLIGSHSTLPESLVDFSDLWKLLEFLNPRVKRFSTTAVRNAIDKTVESTKLEANQHITSASKFSIESDIWTKKGFSEAFIGVHTKFYCAKCDRPHCILLGIEYFDSPHTAIRCKDAISGILSKWGILESQIMRIVSDNGSNYVAAYKESAKPWNVEFATENAAASNSTVDQFGFEAEVDSDEELEPTDYVPEISETDMDEILISRIPCMAHTLELTLKVLETNDQFSSLHTDVKRLIRTVNHSFKAKSEFIRISGGLTLPSYCPTRWSMAFRQFDAIVKHREHIETLCRNLKINCLSNGQFEDAAIVSTILKPFAAKVTEFQSQKDSTIGYAIPSLFELENALDEASKHDSQFAQSLAQLLKVPLNKRFKFLFDREHTQFDPIYSQAMLLDTRYKHYFVLLDEEVQQIALADLKRQVRDRSGTQSAEAAQVDNNIPAESLFAKLLKKRKLDTRVVGSLSEKCEVAVYMGFPVDVKSDPVEFWRSNRAKFPVLSVVALDILCVLSCASGIERVWSICGATCTGMRRRLSGKRLEGEVFLNVNREFIPK